MQVRLLGPVDLVVGGTTHPVPGLRRQAVLATLALNAGEVVSTDRLIDAVWSDQVPGSALNTLQSHVSYLRGLFGASSTIQARPPGYVLQLPGDATDVRVVERLTRQAARTEDALGRVQLLRSALTLRRGPLLGDLAALTWFDRQAERLDGLMLEAELALADARLDLGDHALLVSDLERLAELQPLHEHVHAQLMHALYRSGRQADALAVFRQLSRVLDEDLGVLPGAALRELQQAILRQEPWLRAPRAAVVAAPAIRAVVPAQLPPMVAGFVGRDTQLARLDALLPAAAGTRRDGPDEPVVVVVSGTAGVGKTATALRWAHRVAPRFPDGQLYVDLRGFDAGGSVVEAGEAIRGFLAAFHLRPEQVPLRTVDQIALYRSVLAGRRVLVVLDNAYDADQVRPLLPASPGSVAVVTSRDRLTPLVATEGAVPLPLDLVTRTEAWDLLARRLGQARLRSDRRATDALIDRCARLPLALAVTAARVATDPELPLATLAGQLGNSEAALDALTAGDPSSDVRVVLSWSYHALPADTARLFRLLDLHPGPDLAVPAAASLAGQPLADVRRALTRLTGAHLVSESSSGRYTWHDLMRLYAGERLQARESAAAQRDARRRLLDHYLYAARSADEALHPQFSRVVSEPAATGAALDSPVGAAQAQDWFAAEVPALLQVVRAAVAAGFVTHAWQLAWAMSGHLDRSGRWADWFALQTVVLAATRRHGDRAGAAHAHRDLARACSRLGRPDEAWSHGTRALALFQAAGDVTGRASTHLNLGQLLERRGDHPGGLRHAQEALRLYRSAGHEAGEAYGLNSVGWLHALAGDYGTALACCDEGLVRLQAVGDSTGEADAWDSLGYIHQHLGDDRSAVRCLERAVELFEAGDHRYAAALAVDRLGDCQQALGRLDAARAAWARAAALLDELGHADAGRPRAKLVPGDRSVGSHA